MKIEYAAIIGTVLVVWNRLMVLWNALVKISEPIVKEVEQRAKDGKIDRADRKAIALLAVARLEAEGKIKLNFLSRRIISIVIDHVAQKLPDFVISQGAVEIVTKAKEAGK